MDNILITGAASGIGEATARKFHAQGWQVGLLDINVQALDALSAELGNCWHRTLDVTDSEAATAAIAAFCATNGGRLRVLFNCAGILRFGYFEDIAIAEHQRIMQINVLGMCNMTHAAFPYLKATTNAQVINMGSASGLYGVPELATYSASKFAVRGFTEAMDIEWARHNIRVSDIMPPFVNTPMVSSQTHSPATLKRLGVNLDAGQIAQAVWEQLDSHTVHTPISLQFKLMYWAGQISPAWMSRLTMRWLNRK